MFNKKQTAQYEKFDTIIGKNTNFEGTFKAQGTIRIDGEINGELMIEGNLLIGETGRIIGNISANNVLNAGEVKGNIQASEQLRVTNTGKLHGDVSVSSFILDENAIFEGNCKMVTDTSKGKGKGNKESLLSKAAKENIPTTAKENEIKENK